MIEFETSVAALEPVVCFPFQCGVALGLALVVALLRASGPSGPVRRSAQIAVALLAPGRTAAFGTAARSGAARRLGRCREVFQLLHDEMILIPISYGTGLLGGTARLPSRSSPHCAAALRAPTVTTSTSRSCRLS